MNCIATRRRRNVISAMGILEMSSVTGMITIDSTIRTTSPIHGLGIAALTATIMSLTLGPNEGRGALRTMAAPAARAAAAAATAPKRPNTQEEEILALAVLGNPPFAEMAMEK